MPAPTLGAFAELLYERLEPLAYDDANQDYALAHFCEAVGLQFESLHEVLAADWATLLDADLCPADFLRYFGQFVGVRVPLGATEAVARALVQDPSGFRRGTLASLVAAVQRTLTGSQSVLVTERTSGAYALTVHTLPSETPDEPATLAAARSQKPAGLILTLQVSAGDSWAEVTSTWAQAGGDAPIWYSDIDSNPNAGGANETVTPYGFTAVGATSTAVARDTTIKYNGVASLRFTSTDNFCRTQWEIGGTPPTGGFSHAIGEERWYEMAIYLSSAGDPAGDYYADQQAGGLDFMRLDNFGQSSLRTIRIAMNISTGDDLLRVHRYQGGGGAAGPGGNPDAGGTSTAILGPFDTDFGSGTNGKLATGRWYLVWLRVVLSDVTGEAITELWIDEVLIDSTTTRNTNTWVYDGDAGNPTDSPQAGEESAGAVRIDRNRYGVCFGPGPTLYMDKFNIYNAKPGTVGATWGDAVEPGVPT